MKRDINLLPTKSGGPKKTTGMIVAIVVTFVYVLVFGLGILIPKSIKDAATLVSNQLDNQIVQMQPQVDEYERLKTEFDILKASMESTGSLDFAKYKALDALEIIQSTCPTGIMVDRITVSDTTLIMDITASNNYLIAQFALELERSGHFEDVFISGSSPAISIVDETNIQIDDGNTVRSSLSLVYDLSVVEDETTEDTEGEGDGQ